MIIDAHTHIYPRFVREDPEGWSQRLGERYWNRLHCGKGSLQDWCNRSRMIRQMDADGVDQAVMVGWYWQTPRATRLHNDAMARWMAAQPSRFFAFASWHPELFERPERDMEHLSGMGFQGIGELLPSVQGFSFDHPRFLETMEWAEAHGWPLLLHVTESLGRPHPGRAPTPLQGILRMAERFPDLNIILAHLGGLAFTFELNPYVKERFGRIYYDTAAMPVLYEGKIVETLLSITGPNRLVFGTDYPFRAHRSRQRPADFRSSIDRLVPFLPDRPTREAVLGNNMREILDQTR